MDDRIELKGFETNSYNRSGERYWHFTKGKLTRMFSEKLAATYPEALAYFEAWVAKYEANPTWRRGFEVNDRVYLENKYEFSVANQLHYGTIVGFDDDLQTIHVELKPKRDE